MLRGHPGETGSGGEQGAEDEQRVALGVAQGEALAYLAHGLGRMTTFGIELSYSRAEDAELLLDHVLATGFENAV